MEASRRPSLTRYRFDQTNAAAEESKEHFINFLQTEIEHEGLDVPDYIRPDAGSCGDHTDFCSAASPTVGYKNPEWAKAGEILRKTAQEFAQSRARRKVKQQAEEINMETVHEDEFKDLLQELFKDGCSRECIVALFFFCSDLAICCLRKCSKNYFVRFLAWSLNFITEKVALWVAQHGGWCEVLGSSFHYVKQVTLLFAAVSVFIASSIYIRKHLR